MSQNKKQIFLNIKKSTEMKRYQFYDKLVYDVSELFLPGHKDIVPLIPKCIGVILPKYSE